MGSKLFPLLPNPFEPIVTEAGMVKVKDGTAAAAVVGEIPFPKE